MVHTASLVIHSLNRWYVPFVFLLVLPMLTGPATGVLQDRLCAGYPRTGIGEDLRVACPTPLAVIALAPGLIGLVTLLWLRSASNVVREAAVVATVLALLRILAPSVHMLATGPILLVGGAPFGLGHSFFSPLLWYLTVLAMASHQNWPRRRGREAAP
jgi:hypothetical protein